MTERIRFVVTENALQLQFEDAEKKADFTEKMKEQDIHFTDNGDNTCDFHPYTPEEPCGFFVSKDGRLSLNFETEEQKFFFKARCGIEDEQFMDMGPGYEAQMHFNPKYLPLEPDAEMEVVKETLLSSPKC